MSLKALRERMNDGNYATLAEAVRVLLDDLIARTHPTAGTAGHTVRAEAVPVDVPKTNQGGGGDAAGTASPDARTDSAAAASFASQREIEAQVARGFAEIDKQSVAAASFEERLKARIDSLRETLKGKNRIETERELVAVIVYAEAEIAALKSKLAEERKACDEWRARIATHDNGGGLRITMTTGGCLDMRGLLESCIAHDARRAAEKDGG